MADNSNPKSMLQQNPNPNESSNITNSNITTNPSLEMTQNPNSQQQLDYNQIKSQQFLQQNNLMGYHGLQRTPSLSRLNSTNTSGNANNNSVNNQMGIYGNMSFGAGQTQQQMGGPQNQQQLAGIGGAGNLTRSVLMGQMGNLPMMSNQQATAQLNLQSQLLSPRQKSGLMQGSQFNSGANSAGQTLQGMQAMGMISPLNMNSQMRTNGGLTFPQQQRGNQQMRHPLLQQQGSLTPSQAQGLQRTSYMNAQLSGLNQNGQQAMLQNSVTQQQQQWLKQMPAMSTPNSPSFRVQQQRQQSPSLLQHHQLASSPQLQQNSMGLTPQQLSQLAQQPPTTPQQLLNQQTQSSPRMTAPAGQRTVSLTGSQPDVTASGNTTPGGSSSQGTEASNQLLGKRKIQDLVAQVDPHGSVDPELEDLLLELADDFIDSVTTFACNIAKHRNSTTLEAKDVLLHLEKNWNLTIPGYSSEDGRRPQENVSNDLHQRRLDVVRSLMGSSQSEGPSASNGQEVARQGIVNPGGANNNMMRPSQSSDQLASQSNVSQMGQQMNRF